MDGKRVWVGGGREERSGRGGGDGDRTDRREGIVVEIGGNGKGRGVGGSQGGQWMVWEGRVLGRDVEGKSWRQGEGGGGVKNQSVDDKRNLTSTTQFRTVSPPVGVPGMCTHRPSSYLATMHRHPFDYLPPSLTLVLNRNAQYIRTVCICIWSTELLLQEGNKRRRC